MASCTLPLTTSPGRLALRYIHITQGLSHRIGWSFIAGVSLTDVSDLRVEAERLADLLADCLTANFRFTGWEIQTPGGHTYYTEAFAAPIIGTLTRPTGATDYRSPTICFSGVGLAPAPGVCHGHSISRVFVGDSYLFAPGQKVMTFNLHPELEAFVVGGLNASTYLPADGYGQQADISGEMPVQFNAAVQRKAGT